MDDRSRFFLQIFFSVCTQVVLYHVIYLRESQYVSRCGRRGTPYSRAHAAVMLSERGEGGGSEAPANFPEYVISSQSSYLLSTHTQTADVGLPE